MEELTGYDYMTRPYIELVSHPDFSEKAYRIIIAVSTMETKQLENVNLIGGNNGKRS